MSPKTAPYGSWLSPITSDLIVAESIGLSDILIDGDDIYWIEARPREAGRCVVVRRTADGKRTDMTPAPFSARTRVHEYGGGACTVHQGSLFFANYADQRLYRLDRGAVAPTALTPAPLAIRYKKAAVELRYMELRLPAVQSHGTQSP